MTDDIEELIARLERKLALRVKHKGTRYEFKKTHSSIGNGDLVLVITTLRQTSDPWVPIADIPEEWKGGRDLLLHNKSGRVFLGYWLHEDVLCKGNGDYWFGFGTKTQGVWPKDVTHAMLPPMPPKDKP